MPLPALLVEPQPPPAPLLEVVLPPHPQDRAHPREAVEHHREERPVSEPGQRARVDVLEELPRFCRGQDWRRALGDDVLRPPHRGRWVHREDLADDEPVAEHADRGQVLFHGRDRAGVGADVGGHVERGDRPQPQAAVLAPPQELPHGPPVRRPGSCVRDPPREKLQEPRDGIRPRVDDQRRQDDVGSPRLRRPPAPRPRSSARPRPPRRRLAEASLSPNTRRALRWGASAASTLGSTDVGSMMQPSPPTSLSSTTRGAPARRAPLRRWPRPASEPASPASRVRLEKAPPGSSRATGAPPLPVRAVVDRLTRPRRRRWLHWWDPRVEARS